MIDNIGEIKGVYRKIHMFDVSLGEGTVFNESNFVTKGTNIPPPIDTPIGKLGLSIVCICVVNSVMI